MNKNRNDYINVIYNPIDRPFTEYPDLLSSYLFNRFSLSVDKKILDVGCGRGEFLNGFHKLGLVGLGVDRSAVAGEAYSNLDIKTADIEKDGLPFADESIDYVFSKSVIEHMNNPDLLFQEAMRVLKPGGLKITMCPAWEYNYRIYYEDYTHRSPFMLTALRDAMLINGFKVDAIEYFRQLPSTWNSGIVTAFSMFTGALAPNVLKTKSKWVRFSKEVMLLGVGSKHG